MSEAVAYMGITCDHLIADCPHMARSKRAHRSIPWVARKHRPGVSRDGRRERFGPLRMVCPCLESPEPGGLEPMRAGVYRLWSGDGSLLYVGTSATPLSRIAAHRSRDWWALVDRIEIKSYDSPDHARKAESVAIKQERPIFNLSGRHRYLPVADGLWWSTKDFVQVACPNCGQIGRDRPWAMTYRPDISIADDSDLAQGQPGPTGWQTAGWVLWVGCRALCYPFAMRPADADEIIRLGTNGGGWGEF